MGGGVYRTKGSPGGGTHPQEATWRGLKGVTPPWRLEAWWPPSGCPLASLRHIFRKCFAVIFRSFGDVMICPLYVHFSPLVPASADMTPESCKLRKTSKTL